MDSLTRSLKARSFINRAVFELLILVSAQACFEMINNPEEQGSDHYLSFAELDID